MPRDFVPCLYTEREMDDAVTQTWHLRCEVVEAFAFTDLVTRTATCLLSLESHAYHTGVTLTWEEQEAMPPAGRDAIRHRERARVFDHFYAAMAALE